MNVIKTNITVDHTRLLEEYQNLILPSYDERIMNTGFTTDQDKYCFNGGQSRGMRFHSTSELSLEQERTISNTKEGGKYDHLFIVRNEKCIGYINDVLDFFTDAWRGSWWTLDPGFCYKPHVDRPRTGFRVHIPLTTNSFCHMAYENQEVHHLLADGSVYLAKTNIKHTAWNMGESNRTHIMFKLPMSEWEYYENHKPYNI